MNKWFDLPQNPFPNIAELSRQSEYWICISFFLFKRCTTFTQVYSKRSWIFINNWSSCFSCHTCQYPAAFIPSRWYGCSLRILYSITRFRVNGYSRCDYVQKVLTRFADSQARIRSQPVRRSQQSQNSDPVRTTLLKVFRAPALRLRSVSHTSKGSTEVRLFCSTSALYLAQYRILDLTHNRRCYETHLCHIHKTKHNSVHTFQQLLPRFLYQFICTCISSIWNAWPIPWTAWHRFLSCYNKVRRLWSASFVAGELFSPDARANHSFEVWIFAHGDNYHFKSISLPILLEFWDRTLGLLSR